MRTTPQNVFRNLYKVVFLHIMDMACVFVFWQVTVVHINATSKNAADDKLRQCLRRFANAYSPPATLILISGKVCVA